MKDRKKTIWLWKEAILELNRFLNFLNKKNVYAETVQRYSF